MLTKKEISRLCGVLKSYYMGELIPSSVVFGYYDSEFCEVANPQTMYAEGHSCVNCDVEYRYQPGSYLGEECLVANITIYVGDGKFCKSKEYWDAKDVALF